MEGGEGREEEGERREEMGGEKRGERRESFKWGLTREIISLLLCQHSY